ncbi:NifU family protein [Abyssalbus ytuae]|uniref:NifU family protein n=1 Tax=Abyssalbus ytuae TaxID=2926907 RepID=A0A9E6ZXX6_9FLAO|nr:NifU family protein [Abyssalbus ytuae]UOB18961.1 NifU family protein [Abyssalbus ytuae]
MNNIQIKIQPTSNASIIKFEANKFLVQYTNYEFKNIDEAKNSPLATQLFYLPFTKTVYIAGNFVAVEKYDIVEWHEIQDEVAEQIENYLNSGQPVVIEDNSGKKTPVTVYAESTPNPTAMKFVTNKKIALAPFEFKNIDETKNSELARSLFHFPFIKEVFIDENYVSIIKYDIAEWNDIVVELREFIKNHIEEGKEVISDQAAKLKSEEIKASNPEFANLDETSKQIVDILEEYVKPAVASDGGNIMFDSYDSDSKTVKVILQGACSGCPSSTYTLKNGIETMLKNMLNDKVNEVVAING